MTSPPRPASLDAAAVVLVVGCCLVWGLGQVAIKTALLEGLPPLLQAGLRNLGACALLVAWAAWRGVPLLGRDGSLRGGLLAGAACWPGRCSRASSPASSWLSCTRRPRA